jgi:hypothetical protein
VNKERKFNDESDKFCLDPHCAGMILAFEIVGVLEEESDRYNSRNVDNYSQQIKNPIFFLFWVL